MQASVNTKTASVLEGSPIFEGKDRDRHRGRSRPYGRSGREVHSISHTCERLSTPRHRRMLYQFSRWGCHPHASPLPSREREKALSRETPTKLVQVPIWQLLRFEGTQAPAYDNKPTRSAGFRRLPGCNAGVGLARIWTDGCFRWRKNACGCLMLIHCVSFLLGVCDAVRGFRGCF